MNELKNNIFPDGIHVARLKVLALALYYLTNCNGHFEISGENIALDLCSVL